MMKNVINRQTGMLVVLLLGFAVLPLFVSDYWLSVLSFAFFVGVFAMSWDLLFGYAGEVNFGPTFLIGLGAYGAGMASVYLGWPIWFCIVIGTLVAIVGGVLLSGPALRLTGPYFGLTTLVAVLLLGNFIIIFAQFTGGENGLALPDILTISTLGNYYYALGLMAITGIVLVLLVRSPFGLILQACGQDPVATEAMGFNVAKFKIVAFAVSALFSGLAGAMTAFYFGTASPSALVDVLVTIEIIIAAIIGGRRSIVGGIVGAVFLIVLAELLRPIGHLNNAVVAGFGLLVLVLWPGGFVSLFESRKKGQA